MSIKGRRQFWRSCDLFVFFFTAIQWSDIQLTSVHRTLLWSLPTFKTQLIHLFHSERPYNLILLKELRLSRVSRWWLLTASYPEFPQTAAGCRRVICARFARLYPPSDLTAAHSVTHRAGASLPFRFVLCQSVHLYGVTAFGWQLWPGLSA